MLPHQFTIIGPQGSGKGTQAKALAQLFAVPHISTGDLFRDHVARRTELGLKADQLLRQGTLMPDDITNALVSERLGQPDAQAGFVLDGYPRNLAQAEFLQALASQTQAILLELSDDQAVERIARRLTCQACGAVYHLDFRKPRVNGVCDECGGKLDQRTDDTETAVRERLTIYHRETEPLVMFYQAHKQLMRVDGTPPIEEVIAAIRRALGL